MSTDAGEDSGLRCPECEYNLTGVVEERCPECGTEFDRQWLQQSLAGTPLPRTPFEERPGWGSFWRTWWLVMSDPAGLARRFRGEPLAGRAFVFGLWCEVLAVAPVALLLAIGIVGSGGLAEPLAILYSMLAVVGQILAVAIIASAVEASVAILFALLALHEPQRWYALVRYGAVFLPISSIGAILSYFAGPYGWAVLTVSVVGWLGWLVRIRCAIGGGGYCRVLSIVGLPLAIGLGLFAGGAATYMCGAALGGLAAAISW